MKSLPISNNADEDIKVNFGIRQADGKIKRYLVDAIPNEPLFEKNALNIFNKIIDNNKLLLNLKQLLLVEYNMLYQARISIHLLIKQTSTNKIRFIENEIKLLEEFSIDFDRKSKFIGKNHYIVDIPNYGIIGKIKEFENDQKCQFDKSNDYFFKEFIQVAEFGLINKFEDAQDLLFICPDKDKHQYTYNCRPETSRFWECYLVLVYYRILDYLNLDLEKEKNKISKVKTKEKVNNTFSKYITISDATNKDVFLKKLKENYLINKAPKDYALMILALKQLSLIKIKKGNQTNVYSALKSFLDNTDIGTNEALNKTIRNIEPKLTDKNEHVKNEALKELNPHIETIKNIKKLSKTD